MTPQEIGLAVWAVIALIGYVLWMGKFFCGNERDYD